MSRRTVTLAVAAALVLVLGVVGSILPVPYVALSPGPTLNTLGTLGSGKGPLIDIEGHQAYPTTGNLNFVTVAYQGGPGNRIDLLTALRGWFDSSTAIVPEETIFPKNVPVKQVEQQNTQDMTNSQEAATVAALQALNIPVPTVVSINSVSKGMPADGKLRPGDVITSVNGKKVNAIPDVSSVITALKPPAVVRFTVNRGGKALTADVPTALSSGKTVVGVILSARYRFPFTVKITVGDVGGPSAGLMFSLGIYDKLSDQNITGGKFIAGTGTIDTRGNVGPIGGIQQKMIAARHAGATVFLTPSGNCNDTRGAIPKGLRLVRVDTMQGALQALRDLRAGQGQLPSCPRS